ncbi:MAG: M48 family metallopeptidase [Bacteroidales bacterium]|nr:M48 family metallopeptidase [Bacteroidales bacterium]
MKPIKSLFITALTALVLASCGTASKVPVTGRTHRLSVSDEQVLSLSNSQYKEYMASAKKSTDAANTALVQRVGQRLATAVETYLRDNGFANELQYFNWEFNLVKDNSVNAFCMPGGKIVVYEGLLPVTQDEASLAIVLGHEIAHAVAKHSAEQMSKKYNQSQFTQLGGAVLSSAVGSGAAQVATAMASIGLQFANAHYSRENESEADHMGLVFAAMAGYDPAVAISFWQRMSAASGGGSSSYLSSHPSDAKRITDIQKWLPEAQQYYAASKGAGQATSNTSTKSSAKSSTKKTNTSKATTSKKFTF